MANHLIYHVAAALIALLRAVLRHVPLRGAVAAGALLGRAAGLVARRERRRAADNLLRVWPTMSPRRRRALVSEVFTNLGRGALECLVLDRMLASRRCVFATPGRAVLEDALAAGRGVVFVTAHYGNWELMAAAVAQVGQVCVLARRSYDDRFTRLIDRFRRSHGIRCLWVERTSHLREAVRALRSNAIVGVLVDQPVRGAADTPFLGQPAPTTGVVSALVRMSGARVVAGFINRRPGGRHEVTIQSVEAEGPAGQDPYTIAVETAVRRRPDLWVWSLDRWRFAERTPDVANIPSTLRVPE